MQFRKEKAFANLHLYSINIDFLINNDTVKEEKNISNKLLRIY